MSSKHITPELRKLYLYFISKNKKLTNVSIAAKLNVSESYIRNLRKQKKKQVKYFQWEKP